VTGFQGAKASGEEIRIIPVGVFLSTVEVADMSPLATNTTLTLPHRMSLLELGTTTWKNHGAWCDAQ